VKTSLVLALATLVPGMFLMQANGGPVVAVIDFERTIRKKRVPLANFLAPLRGAARGHRPRLQ